MRWCLCVVLMFGALACVSERPEQVISPDPTASGALSERGPYGAGRWERTLRVRVDQTVDVDLTVPTGPDGEVAGGEFPIVVFVQGGLVSPARYRWLTDHIATRGFIVISAYHATDLALFQTGISLDAVEAVYDLAGNPNDPLFEHVSPKKGMVLGHSLGGVVAATLWLRAPGVFSHLVMVASEPNEAEDFSGRVHAPDPGRVLAITGTADGRITPQQVQARLGRIDTPRVPRTMAVIEDMNHTQFTQDPTADELSSDTLSPISEEVARTRSLYLIDAMLDDLVTGASGAFDREARWPEGVLRYDDWLGGAP